MGWLSTPAAPAPPDYGASTQAASEWSPVLQKIEQARRLGKKVEYVNPKTGETEVADYRGF